MRSNLFFQVKVLKNQKKPYIGLVLLFLLIQEKMVLWPSLVIPTQKRYFPSFIFDYKNIDSNGNSISSSLCQVSWLQEDHKRRGEGPSVINEFILTPAAVEEDESSNVYEENKYERVVLDQPVKQSASVRYSYFSFFLLMTNMFKNLTKNLSFCSP